MVPASSDGERHERAARNHALYREINERVKKINEAFDSILPLGDWICECANRGCTARLPLTHEEYESLRTDGARFAVFPHEEHVFPEVENVVERHERYWVVEKTGMAAALTEQVNPRTNE
jgi:hypothetical protein